MLLSYGSMQRNFWTPEKDAGVYIDIVVNLAAAYQTLGYLPKAFETLNRAAPVIEKSWDNFRKAQFFSTLGDVCFSLGDIQKAFACLEQAPTEVQQTDDPLLLAGIFNHVGIVFAKDGGFQGAGDAFDACLYGI